MNNTFYLENYTLNNNLVPHKKFMIGIIGAALFLLAFSLIALLISWRATRIRKRLRTSLNSKNHPTAAVKVSKVIASGNVLGLKSLQLPKPVSDIDVEFDNEKLSSQSSNYDNHRNDKFRERAKSSSMLSGSSEFLNLNLTTHDSQRCDHFRNLEDGDSHLHETNCPCQLNDDSVVGLSSFVSDVFAKKCENKKAAEMKLVTANPHCHEFWLYNTNRNCNIKKLHAEENKPVDVQHQHFVASSMPLQPINHPVPLNTRFKNAEKPVDFHVAQEMRNPKKLHQIEFKIEMEPLKKSQAGFPFKANFLSDLAETEL